jgi:apolipoprotein N-acyltransferase
MARLRALETARPMLRAANTGPSAAIDHRGQMIARSPQFRTTILRTEIQPMRGTTPYVRDGNLPAVLFAGFLLTAGWISSRRRR